MIDRKHRLSVTRQATLLGLSRGSAYYLPQPVGAAALALMRRLDELHLEHPFMGARMLRCQLLAAGHPGRPASRADAHAAHGYGGFVSAARHQPAPAGPQDLSLPAAPVSHHPRESGLGAGHDVHPHGARVCLPHRRGGVASRLVLAHKVAISLEACHAREIIAQAFARFGVPAIVNTDQGSQFTAEEFTQAVFASGCKLSMDGRGAWRDNVFIERLWRSVKYECVYLKAYDGVSAARSDIGRYLDWFNTARAHSRLNGVTPQQAYLDLTSKLEQAA